MPPDALPLPAPSAPDPESAPGLRWGIISPGHIAGQFAGTAHRATASQVVAVASRSQDRAEGFAAEHGIDAAYDSVEAMLAAGGLDAVYVASPHAQHHAFARQVLEAGVPVLVEKAFTLNAQEGQDLLDLAERQGVFAMEAMWSRFLPQYDVLRQLVAAGLLGRIVEVSAEHGQFFPEDPGHRLYAPQLGGGALLDLGVYPLSLAQMLLGDLEDLAVRGDLTSTGVDATVGVLARGRDGALARLGTTLRARCANEATIVGTQGRARLAGPFFAPTTLTVELHDGRTARLEHPGDPGDGFAWEIAEAARCITAGRRESGVMPWADTLSVLRTMDAIRANLGVVYPGEETR